MVNDLKQVAQKNIIIYVSVATIYFIATIAFVMLKMPDKVSEEVTNARNRENISLIERTKALEYALSAEVKKNEYLRQRDSFIIAEVQMNRSAISKIKFPPDENNNRYNDFGSREWAMFLSGLPEPQR